VPNYADLLQGLVTAGRIDGNLIASTLSVPSMNGSVTIN
jgi:hypothetical protein